MSNKNNSKNRQKITSGNKTTGQNIYLKLILTFDETSKDSNWNTTIIEINNSRIKYSYEYGGFPEPESDHKEKKVNTDLINKIINYIQKEGLNKNIKESKKTDGIGIAGFLTIEVVINESKTQIEISGKTNIWGSDEYVKREWGKKYIETRINIENKDYFDKAENLISIIKDILY